MIPFPRKGRSSAEGRLPVPDLLRLAGAALGAGLLIAAAVFFLPSAYLPFLLILGLLVLLAALILRQPVWLLYVLVPFAAFASLGNQVESLQGLGTTVSISGLGWVFCAGIICITTCVRIRRLSIPAFAYPFLLFVGWTGIRWLSSPMRMTGLKDILFYGLPPLVAVFALWILPKNRAGIARRLENLILATACLPAGLYLLLIPMGLVSYTANGPVGAIDSRGLSLYLLTVLAVALARWRYGKSPRQRKMGALIALVASATILFTLSRMAMFAAVLMLSLGLLNPSRFRSVAFGAVLAASLTAAAVLLVPPLQERFFRGAPSDLGTLFTLLRTSGRNEFWPLTFEHAFDNPIIGFGPGSARILIAQTLRDSSVHEYFPHNEYLQVFHDMGCIGLGLLLSGYITLFLRLWKQWGIGRAGRGAAQAGRNLAAFLGITAVLVTSITANTLHYAFVTVPVFLLVSLADVQNRMGGETVGASDIVKTPNDSH